MPRVRLGSYRKRRSSRSPASVPTARPREAFRALSTPAYTSTTRPLDALAAGIVVVLCLSWGFNQVATKLALHDIPPLTQAAVRSAVATLLIAAWCRLRGIALLERDGTLWFGFIAGLLFAAEFILIYQGLLYTTATRAVLFIYLAPFFVVLGAR